MELPIYNTCEKCFVEKKRKAQPRVPMIDRYGIVRSVKVKFINNGRRFRYTAPARTLERIPHRGGLSWK